MKINPAQQGFWILQEKYGGKMTAAAQRDIGRLTAGQPVDYIIGWVDFLGCKIDLSKKPLIPRVETEYWTEHVINDLRFKIQDSGIKKIRVLDMFSGSGAIGISIVRHMKNAHVTFVDSEQNCIKQIKKNCKINKIPARQYSVVQSDMFSNLESKILNPESVFDIIAANPPYISTKNKHKVQLSTLAHEPHAALFGGGDGLSLIRKFLAQARPFMAPGSVLYMEFDSPQKPAIAKLLKQYGYTKWEFHKDQFNRWRWLSACP